MHSQKLQPPPLHYLRWLSLFLFLLSLGAMFSAGLLYSEMQGAEAREALARDGAIPQEWRFTVSLVASVSLAMVAAIVFIGTALTERLLDVR